MIWIPLIFGKRIVATVHGLDWKRAKWNKFASYYLKFGEWMAANFAHEVIVLCKNNQDYFMEKYGRSTVLIPNGLKIYKKCPAEIITSKYGIGNGDYILYLARIVPEKCVHQLIDAFLQVNTDKKLVIAGELCYEDKYTQEVLEMAKKDSNIIFTNLATGLEWEELFSNCCLYVLPSAVEGMPISLLEAIGFGCRCLASDIDENKETGKDAVNYFKQGDVENLTLKLQQLLDFPTDNKEVNTSQWEDWDTITDTTIELYKKVINL